jgi:hypothetical protein
MVEFVLCAGEEIFLWIPNVMDWWLLE